MRYVLAFTALMLSMTMLPGPVQAAEGYSSTSLNMRAGPSGKHPLVGRIGSRTAVNVHSCVAGYKWCDVSAGGSRGWVQGDYIRSRHQRREGNLLSLGPRIGLPVTSYNQRDYWGQNYYDRDFYRSRYGWNNDHKRYGWRKQQGKWTRDTDRDGIINKYDRDDDNDGIRDSRDRDDDGNGIRDNRERNYRSDHERSDYRRDDDRRDERYDDRYRGRYNN